MSKGNYLFVEVILYRFYRSFYTEAETGVFCEYYQVTSA
jgi:hypothetical protein